MTILRNLGRGLTAATRGAARGLPQGMALREAMLNRQNRESELSKKEAAAEAERERERLWKIVTLTKGSGDPTAQEYGQKALTKLLSLPGGESRPVTQDTGPDILPETAAPSEVTAVPSEVTELPQIDQVQGYRGNPLARALMAPEPEKEHKPSIWSAPSTSSEYLIQTDSAGELRKVKNPAYVAPGETPVETAPFMRVGNMLIGRDYKAHPIPPEALAFERSREEYDAATLAIAATARYTRSRDMALLRGQISMKKEVREATIGAVTRFVHDLDSGMAPDKAEHGIRTALSFYGKKVVADALNEVSDIAMGYDLEIKWSPGAETELRELAVGINHADSILLSLNDPNLFRALKAELGPRALFENLDEILRGGRMYSPPVQEFLSYLTNFRDSTARDRTGAAMPSTEEQMYGRMIGTSLTDPDAIRIRVNSLKKFMTKARDAEWGFALDDKFQTDEEGRFRAYNKYLEMDGRAALKREEEGDAPSQDIKTGLSDEYFEDTDTPPVESTGVPSPQGGPR